MTVIHSHVGRYWVNTTPYQLTLDRLDRRWLDLARSNAELAAADDDRRRLRGPGRKVNAAVNRLTEMSATVAQALAAASVAEPPPPPMRSGRGGSDVSDPTLSRIEATWNTVDRACVTFAHLLGTCPDPACVVCERRKDTLEAIADTLGLDVDLAVPIDALLGTPATSRVSFLDALDTAVLAVADAAVQVGEGWHHLDHDGDRDDLLKAVADRLSNLAGRMTGLVDAVTQWLPASRVRICAGPECRHPAPPMGEGATCQKCRDANRKRNKEAS